MSPSLLSVAIFLRLTCTSTLYAASGTWLGNSGSWNDTATWSAGSVADGVDSSANFTGVDITTDQTVTLGVGRTIGNISFADAATSSNNLLITGNTLTLDVTTGIPLIDVAQSDRTLTISSALGGTKGLKKVGAGNLIYDPGALSSTFSGLNINGGTMELKSGTINVNGGVDFGANPEGFSVANEGIFRLNGGNVNLTDDGFYLFPAGVYSSGTFILDSGTIDGGNRIAIVGYGTNGTTTINAGQFIAGQFQLGASTSNASLSLNGGILQVNNLANGGTSSTVNFNGGTLKAKVDNANFVDSAVTTAGIQAGGAVIDSNGFNITIAKSLTEDGGSTGGGLTKIGGGTLALSGGNTYSGATTVNGGTLEYRSSAAVGSTSKITVNRGGSIYFPFSGATISQPINLNGPGDLNGTNMRIDAEGGELTFSGTIALLGNSRVFAYANNSTLNITNVIEGTGDFSYLGYGSGVSSLNWLVLSGANTFSGDLYLDNYATSAQVTLGGGSDRLPTTAVVHLGAGAWNSLNSSVLNLNGNHQTLAGLSDSDVTSLAGNRSVVNTSGTAAKLTLDVPIDQSFSGSIGGVDISGATGNNLALEKRGPGMQALSGDNSYLGTTLVSGGALKIGGDLGTSAVTVNSGASLILAGSGVIGAAITMADGATLDVTDGRFVTGGLTMANNCKLKISTGTAGNPSNSFLQVNGNLVLGGKLCVYDRGGATSGQISAVIQYSGSLINNGLVVDDELSQWNVTLDSSTPGQIAITLIQKKFPTVQFTCPNQTVSSSLQLNMSGKMNGFGNAPLSYEVRTPDGQLWDFGSMAPNSNWTIYLRHLQIGVNIVRVMRINASGTLDEDTRTVTLELGSWPAVRPRPKPAEIWWGGVATGQTPNYGYDQLVDPSKPWNFVKKYQDGVFLHGILPTSGIRRKLATVLEPTLGRLGQEGSFYCDSRLTYGSERAEELKLHLETLATEKIYLSLISPDWNPGLKAWPAGGISAGWFEKFPGYTHQELLDANMQQWTDFVQNVHGSWPGLKMGLTWTPIVFNWNGFPSLAPDGLIEAGSFNYDMQEFFDKAKATAAAGDGYFAFASDCPHYYIVNWGDAAQRSSLQQKIIGYEAWLHSQGRFHTRICNADGTDAEMRQNGYEVLTSQQLLGGRARTYLFESWYDGPNVWAPETAANSHSGTAMKAIKYLKGVKNLAGDLETLELARFVADGITYIKLKNTGDVECLPAIAGIASGIGPVLQYFDSNGNDITSTLLSDEGYVPPDVLGVGQTMSIHVNDDTTGFMSGVTLEAFWNPQDPTGIVRSRIGVSPLDVSFPINPGNPQWPTAISPYDLWKAKNGLDNAPGREGSFTADPDGDGIANGLEWALGTTPLTNAVEILPKIVPGASSAQLSFKRNTGSISNCTLLVEYGSDLSGWLPVSIGSASSPPDAYGVTTSITTNGDGYDAVLVTIPNSNLSSGRLFARLKVIMNFPN